MTDQIPNPRPASTLRPGRDHRIRAWDGFRALSIIWIIAFHADFKGPGILDYFSNGSVAVRLFFVLSGALITKLLLVERSTNGSINIGAFYIRRTAKIVPSLYIYVAVIFLCSLWFGTPVTWIAYVKALTFTTGHWSIQPNHQVLAHTWTLSIEECFYLLWAPLLAFGVVLKSRRSPLPTMAVVLAVSYVARVLLEARLAPFRPLFPQGFLYIVNWFDALAVGGALGIALADDVWRERLVPVCRKFRGPAWIVLLVAVLMHPPLMPRLITVLEPLGETLQELAMATLLAAYTVSGSGFGSRILNSRLITYIGRASYSLYIWQQFFFYPMVPGDHWWLKLPTSIFLAVATGLAGYHFVEIPILKWARRRFAWAYEITKPNDATAREPAQTRQDHAA